ncbi:MAG TPA: DoxX family protein [Candidatus Limnocylindria bacterium]|nr:DoxX family protein [Candidatus Limnocylindria bacterium]
MRGIAGIDPGWGVTAVRIATGLILLHAGYQKVAGGLDDVAAGFAGMGIPLSGLVGPAVAIFEVVGGAALLAGLFGRWLGLLVALQFAVISFAIKGPGTPFSEWYLDLLLLAAGILLFLAGSGKAAVDNVWPRGRRDA